MSNFARIHIYKPQTLWFEMQRFGHVCICWFSGAYNTQRIIFSTFFPFEILQTHFRFKPVLNQIASSFYQTASSSHSHMWHQKLSLWHIKMNHIIVGNAAGFKKALRIRGVGYRFELSPLQIKIHVGYSHLVSQKLSLSSLCQTLMLSKKSTQIHFQNPHFASLNLYAAMIRNLRQPDVYKGKGIRYRKDFVQRKEGKKKKI